MNAVIGEHPASLRHARRLAIAAVLLCFTVVVFGAFVRLSNAGLSCPDWPTCYGKLAWPVHETAIAAANAAFDRPVEVHKAWREQLHRMLAGALVLATFALAWLLWRVDRRQPVPWRTAGAASGLIVFQALLGMWTVTLKLKPIVVMAHLLGGMATLALLVYIATCLVVLARRELPASAPLAPDERAMLPRAALIAGISLVGMQIALGGWTSSNYAALACGFDFPKCLGQWWPATDFRDAFVLWRGIGLDYEGGVLDGPARVAIQLSHRLFAVLVVGHLLALAVRLIRSGVGRVAGVALVTLVVLQIALGIGNVRLGLPLPVATLHSAGAALLLALLVALLAHAHATAHGSHR